MRDSEIRERARALAICIINACKTMDSRNGVNVLISQVIRSATSIGANVHEANYAASRADFANKLQIALKECYETEYWIDLLEAIQAISVEFKEEVLQQSGTIRRMLVKSINTVKESL